MKRLTTRGPRWSAFPVDLVVVVAYTVVAVAATSAVGGPARTVLGLPLVLFVPGYVLLALLFPRRADAGDVAGESRPGAPAGRREPTWGERLGLAIGASLALVALLALVVTALVSTVGVREVTISLGAVSLVGATLAAARRFALPPEDRLRFPWHRPAMALRSRSAPGRFDALVTLVLVVGIVGAASAMAYSVAAPERGAQYTEFALLSENESGELVAAGYPTTFEPGESHRLTAAVTNYEGRTVEYTLVVEVQRVDADGSAVVEERELHRLSRSVEPGATWNPRHVVDPSLAGEGLRLAYYLYTGDAPADASADAAYRRLHLWIDVQDGTDTTAAVGPAR